MNSEKLVNFFLVVISTVWLHPFEPVSLLHRGGVLDNFLFLLVELSVVVIVVFNLLIRRITVVLSFHSHRSLPVSVDEFLFKLHLSFLLSELKSASTPVLLREVVYLFTGFLLGSFCSQPFRLSFCMLLFLQPLLLQGFLFLFFCSLTHYIFCAICAALVRLIKARRVFFRNDISPMTSNIQLWQSCFLLSVSGWARIESLLGHRDLVVFAKLHKVSFVFFIVGFSWGKCISAIFQILVNVWKVSAGSQILVNDLIHFSFSLLVLLLDLARKISNAGWWMFSLFVRLMLKGILV